MGLISNGTTIFDAGAIDSGIAKGAMTFIKKLTASNSANLTFLNGSSNVVLDSTYKEYIFKFYDVHPSTQSSFFFNMSVDSGSNYNVAKTTTYFHASNNEAGGSNEAAYQSGSDLAQGTGFQRLQNFAASNNDDCCVGTLHLFDPSSTTFVKFFNARVNFYEAASTRMIVNHYTAVYFNTTSAIDEISFKMASGNIDSGTFKLYGIK